MRYFLVMLDELSSASAREAHLAEHEHFVDSMVARNLVLLGGEFDEKVGASYAAYVLAADGTAAAMAIAADDPLVRHGHVSPHVVEWCLIGINRRAIAPEQWLEPTDG
jgi:uncharacterized protein YciI